MWFIVNIAFVKIDVGLFALFKIVGVFKHYFPFFVERPSSDDSLEEFLSLFFFASGIDLSFFIKLIEGLSLQFFHRVIFAINFYEVHRKSFISLVLIINLFILNVSPQLFHVVATFVIRLILIFIDSVLSEIFYWGLSAFDRFVLLTFWGLISVGFGLSIEFGYRHSVLVRSPVFHFLIWLKIELFTFLFGNNCKVFLIKPSVSLVVIEVIRGGVSVTVINWRFLVLLLTRINPATLFSCSSSNVFVEF